MGDQQETGTSTICAFTCMMDRKSWLGALAEAKVISKLIEGKFDVFPQLNLREEPRPQERTCWVVGQLEDVNRILRDHTRDA